MVNYPDFSVCPYNALHRFPTKESLREHMFNCQSKIEVQPILDAESGKGKHNVPLNIPGIREFNLAEENWDEM